MGCRALAVSLLVISLAWPLAAGVTEVATVAPVARASIDGEIIIPVGVAELPRGVMLVPAGETAGGRGLPEVAVYELREQTWRTAPANIVIDGPEIPPVADYAMASNLQMALMVGGFNLDTGVLALSSEIYKLEVEEDDDQDLVLKTAVLDGTQSNPGTSDPTTILPLLGGSNRITLLEIGSIQGLNEFSGSAAITNYSVGTASLRADFFQRGSSGATATENLIIAAGETLGYIDLGAELFGVSGDVGTVVLTTSNQALIGATGREFAILRDSEGAIVGTAGQLMAGQTDADRLAPGRTYDFIGLRQAGSGDAIERSHFAVFNSGIVDAEVKIRLFNGSSGSLEGQRSWTVGRQTLMHINNVIRQINPAHDDREKRIEVEVDTPVFMNVFRVNRWGDPVTLSAF